MHFMYPAYAITLKRREEKERRDIRRMASSLYMSFTSASQTVHKEQGVAVKPPAVKPYLGKHSPKFYLIYLIQHF